MKIISRINRKNKRGCGCYRGRALNYLFFRFFFVILSVKFCDFLSIERHFLIQPRALVSAHALVKKALYHFFRSSLCHIHSIAVTAFFILYKLVALILLQYLTLILSYCILTIVIYNCDKQVEKND